MKPKQQPPPPSKTENLHIRNSPNTRKMTVDSSRPIRIPNAYIQDSRKKLIAPFQKRQPSQERSHIATSKKIEENKQTGENKTKGKTPLYCLIKSSIQNGNITVLNPSIVNKTSLGNKPPAKRDRTAGQIREKQKEEMPPNKGRMSCQDKIVNRNSKEQENRRFFSRRENLNYSKGRNVKRQDENQPRNSETGSRLKERIRKFLYQPTDAPIILNKDDIKIKQTSYAMLKGTIDRKKVKIVGVGQIKKVMPA